MNVWLSEQTMIIWCVVDRASEFSVDKKKPTRCYFLYFLFLF